MSNADERNCNNHRLENICSSIRLFYRMLVKTLYALYMEI